MSLKMHSMYLVAPEIWATLAHAAFVVYQAAPNDRRICESNLSQRAKLEENEVLVILFTHKAC